MLKAKTKQFFKCMTDPSAALRETGARAALHEAVSFLAVPQTWDNPAPASA
ncbi:MAG: hypothetical protein ACI8PT_001353 [Gammaproteobacteria bacterium]|jgi:hypothetical protein